jgi:hypothetical protein
MGTHVVSVRMLEPVRQKMLQGEVRGGKGSAARVTLHQRGWILDVDGARSEH